LLKAGLAGSRNTKAVDADTSAKPTDKKDVLDSLLRDVLKPKQGQ
jgi:hypothetical protein